MKKLLKRGIAPPHLIFVFLTLSVLVPTLLFRGGNSGRVAARPQDTATGKGVMMKETGESANEKDIQLVHFVWNRSGCALVQNRLFAGLL
ncbi:MAG TPA: hypothetical protein VGL29_10390 [Blastocatellia bacterium]|jgi:hypothetical protein